jgi:RNA polymerase nonessential primary-like sigma factor
MNIGAVSSLKSLPRKESPAIDVVFGSDALMGASLPTASKHAELLKDLPPLATIVVATSKEERTRLATKLLEIGEALSCLTRQPDPHDVQVIRALADADTVLNDRITRGLTILNNKEIPEDVGPLSPSEQNELVQAMDDKRHVFWTKLYEVPFVQREAIATLESLETKQGIIATIILPPRTDEYRNADKATRDAMLLESTRESLRKIREIAEHSDAGIGSDYRQKVATILARTPLAPEHALALASECKRKAQSLIDAEIRSSRQNIPDEHHALLADFGAPALQVRSFISELARLEEPYIRLKNYMVMSVAGLAHSVVNRSALRTAADKIDLFQSGIVGIMRGIERFDPGYGSKLSTAIFPWITQAIRVERSVTAFAVSVPFHKQSEFFKVRALSQQITNSNGLLEIAAQQGVSAEDALAFTALLSPARSLDYETQSLKGGSSMSLNETVADRSTLETDDGLDREDLKHQLSLAFQRLNPTERTIVSMFYGLDGTTRKSDAEISAEIGMSTERVRSYRTRSLARLQRDSAAQGINEIYGARYSPRKSTH